MTGILVGRTAAAANNAEWCDVVARSHGLTTLFTDEAWSTSTRSPPYYPDAVTLTPAPSIPALLARIDNSAGCSIKDSFAALDLTAHGFHVLFDAQWIVRPNGPGAASTRTALEWRRIDDGNDLAAWEQAWRGEDGPEGLFRPDLLDHPSVAVLAGYERDGMVAGVICNRSDVVVGVTNAFTTPGLDPSDWAGCLGLVESLFPDQTTVVGYESGGALTAAEEQGFRLAGPLRIWIR